MSHPKKTANLSRRNLRALGAVIVIVLAVSAFASGVNTTNVTDMHSESPAGWLYFAVGLFVLGGLDLGTPAGGALPARLALWAAYFLAPLLTTTVIAETMLMMIRPDLIAKRRQRQHVILVGSGNTTNTYADAIHVIEPERIVVQLEHCPAQAVHYPDSRLNPSLLHIQGDARFPETLEAAGLDKAHRVIFITDDDLLNLEAAWQTLALRPEMTVAVHVADLALLRPVNRLLRNQRSNARNKPAPHVFSTHRIGALHLYEQHLYPYFESTAYLDHVVIAGFGSYSQTLLELLSAMAADELDRITIIDPAATQLLRQFRTDVDTGEIDIAAIDGELSDPGTWVRAKQAVASQADAPLYILNSEDERANLKAAMLLRRETADSKIFITCFSRSEFAQSLCSELRAEIVATEELLINALRDHYEGLTSLTD